MDATLITAWNALVNPFLPVFTQPTGPLFFRLVAGWLLCTGRRTVTRIFSLAEPAGQRTHDAYHRFFPDAAWSLEELWRRLLLRLVQTFYPTGILPLDLDDTLYHRSGRRVEGAGWWRDAVRSTATKVVHAWGLNLVVVTLRVTPPWGGMPLGLPVLMRLHRKGGPGLIEIAEAMLRQIATWLPERAFQLGGDGFYASLAGAGLPRLHLISRMRRDAALYELPPARRPLGRRGRKPKRGRRLPSPREMAPRVRKWQRVTTWERGHKRQRLIYARQVLWYKVAQDPVLLVISRDPAGKEKDDFFFTTDLTLKPAAAIGAFAGRWSIEETFKNAKQLLGGQQPQTWQRLGPERAAGLSLWLYSLTWLWFLQQKKLWRVAVPLWYADKRRPSFADALTALRRVLWQERIKSMFGKRAVHERNYLFLIEKLASAA